MSTLTITLSRTELSLTPLVLSAADDANALGVANYVEPARLARVKWAPPSNYVHGDQALASTLQQSMLSFDVVTDQAATESASRASLALLRAALGQFAFTATVVVDGATAEVWACNTGSMTNNGRSFFDLLGHDPVWAVSIPCHPVPS